MHDKIVVTYVMISVQIACLYMEIRLLKKTELPNAVQEVM
jgi:hypothetical protein